LLQRLRQALAIRSAAWIKRRQGDDATPLTVHGRRVYILPTKAGFGVAGLLFLMLLAGLNYNNSLALFLTFWLAGFLVVVMHMTHRNLLGLRVLGLATQDGFADELGKVIVTIQNDAAANRGMLTARIGARSGAPTDVPAREVRRLEIDLALARRGVWTVPRIRVATRFPFGLFEAWTWLHLPATVLAYPVPRGPRSPPLTSTSGLESHALHRAGDDEWSSLRAFRDGDSPRQVAWRAYARGGDLLVKEYESPAGDQRVFALADLADLPVEAGLEQLAAWCVAAHARGERFGLDLPGELLPPADGLPHRDRCLGALARFRAVPTVLEVPR
jgi:uncharacterized protein (DUF58 family)